MNFDDRDRKAKENLKKLGNNERSSSTRASSSSNTPKTNNQNNKTQRQTSNSFDDRDRAAKENLNRLSPDKRKTYKRGYEMPEKSGREISKASKLMSELDEYTSGKNYMSAMSAAKRGMDLKKRTETSKKELDNIIKGYGSKMSEENRQTLQSMRDALDLYDNSIKDAAAYYTSFGNEKQFKDSKLVSKFEEKYKDADYDTVKTAMNRLGRKAEGPSSKNAKTSEARENVNLLATMKAMFPGLKMEELSDENIKKFGQALRDAEGGLTEKDKYGNEAYREVQWLKSKAEELKTSDIVNKEIEDIENQLYAKPYDPNDKSDRSESANEKRAMYNQELQALKDRINADPNKSQSEKQEEINEGIKQLQRRFGGKDTSVRALEPELENLKGERYILQGKDILADLDKSSDFKEQSQKITEDMPGWLKGTKETIEDYQNPANAVKIGSDVYDGNLALMYITDDERARLRYMWNTQGEKAVIDYVNNYLRYDLNQRFDTAANGIYSEWAKDNPVGMSALSVATNLGSGMAYLDTLGQKAGNALKGESDKPVDWNRPVMTGTYGFTTNVRDTVANDVIGGGFGGFLYQTVMSMADSGAIMALTAGAGAGMGAISKGAQFALNNAGTMLLGGAAATSAAKQAKEAGASDSQALAIGALEGAAETIFENVSLGNLQNLAGDLSGVTLKKFFMNILKQGMVEGSEEVFTTLANTLSEAVILGDKSSYSQSLQQYLNMGYSQEEADKMATKDWWNQLFQDFMGGFVSGGMFGAGGSFVARSNYNKLGKTIINAESGMPYVESVIANISDETNEAVQFAENLKENPDNIDKSSIGTLMGMVDDYAKTSDQAMDEANKTREVLESSNIIDRMTQGIRDERAAALEQQNNEITLDETAKRSVDIQTGKEQAVQSGSQQSEGYTQKISTNDTAQNNAQKTHDVTVTRNGKAVKLSTRIEVTDTDSIDNSLTMKLSDSTEVSSNDVQFRDKKTQELIAQTKGLVDDGWTVDQIQSFIDNYDGKTDPGRYAAAFKAAAFRASVDNSNDTFKNSLKGFTSDIAMILTGDQIRAAYTVGLQRNDAGIDIRDVETQTKAAVKESAAVAQETQTNIDKAVEAKQNDKGQVKQARRSNFTYEHNVKDSEMNETQKKNAKNLKALEHLSKALGIKIVARDSIDIKTKDGKVIKSGANGKFVRSKGTIYISLDAENPLRVVLSHELTHFIQAYSPSLYEELKSYIRDYMNAKVDSMAFDETVEYYMEKYNLDRNSAIDEVVADACDMFLDSKTFTQEMADEIAKTHRNLAEKIRDFIEKLLKDLASFFSEDFRQSNASAYLQSTLSEENLNALKTMWDKALTNAVRTYNSLSESEMTDLAKDPLKSIQQYSLNARTTQYIQEYTDFTDKQKTDVKHLYEAIVKLADIHKRMVDISRGEFGRGRSTLSIHEMNEVLEKHPEMWDELIQIRDSYRDMGIYSDFVTDRTEDGMTTIQGMRVRGGIRGLPIEYRMKEDGSPVFKHFWRSLTQIFIDNMNPGTREDFRALYTAATEQAYEASKGKFMPDLLVPEFFPNLKDYEKAVKAYQKESAAIGGETSIGTLKGRMNEEKLQTPIRDAEKTVMSLNLNSACPMFTVGNHGCYLDACYLTQMGKGAMGTNLFQSAFYSGEILLLKDSDIRKMNALGGLRLNGVGDTTSENRSQMIDIIKHANMRGLKVKVITKQMDTLMVMKEAHDRGIDLSNVTVQPSMDYLWLPVEMDDVLGSGVRGELANENKASTGIGATIRAMNETTDTEKKGDYAEQIDAAYDVIFGRATMVKDGVMYRKYGFSADQINAMMREFDYVKIVPRYVVCTAEELAETALNRNGNIVNNGDIIQTLMHGVVPKECISDYGGEILNFGAARHVIEKDADGNWDFYGVIKNKKTGKDERMNSRPHQVVLDYVRENYTPEEQNIIWTRLKGSACCQNNDFKDACAGCQSLCAGGCGLFSIKPNDGTQTRATGQLAADEGVQYSAKYDFTKPFSEQVDDWVNGVFPKRDSLLLGATPEVLQNIGLTALPLTINQRHVDYAINGTKDINHNIGIAILKDLPNLIAHPVAIIESVSNGKTNNSIVVIFSKKHNGHNIIGAVQIDGYAHINNIRYDSNAVTSTYARNNAITKLLSDAVQKEINKQTAIYYYDKKRADALLKGARVQFSGSFKGDGYINNINDSGSPVNKKFSSQTDTQQFQRWFKNSTAVNNDGNPLQLITFAHYSNPILIDMNDEGADYGDGVYMTVSGDKFSNMGDNKLTVYSSIQKPFDVSQGLSHRQAAYIVEEYGSISHDVHANNEVHYDDAIVKLTDPKTVMSMLKEYANDAGLQTSDLLKDVGYDGIHDGDVWVAFNVKQVKSATNNNGLFSEDTENIYYSLKDSTDEQIDADYLDAVKSGDKATAQRMVDEYAKMKGYSVKVYHISPNKFTVFNTRAERYGEKGFNNMYYFTPNKAWARAFGREELYLERPKPMELYLNPGSVLDATSEEYMMTVPEWFAFFEKNGIEITDAMRKNFRGNALPNANTQKLPLWALIQYDFESGSDYETDYVGAFRRAGYDSIHMPDVVHGRGYIQGDTYVVFDKNRAKSANAITYDNHKKPVPLSQRFNKNEDDIRYSLKDMTDEQIDADYMKAVESGDLETAQAMVDEYARIMGYSSPMLYHGTDEYDWNDGDPKQRFRAFKANEWITEENGISRIKGYFSEDREYSKAYGVPFSYYVKMNNPLIIPETEKTFVGWKKWFVSKGITGVKFDTAIAGDTLKGATNDNGKKTYIPYEFLDYGQYWNGDGNVTERIEAAGYDGIRWDYDEKAWMPFNANAIKSADPVTYDKNGNIIPLSQRFNEAEEDVYYSLKESVDAFAEIGKIKTGESTEVLMSIKDTDSMSNREILAGAYEVVAQTDKERRSLELYRESIETLDGIQAKLDEARKEIHTIMFTKGGRAQMGDHLAELQDNVKKWEKQLTLWDGKLIRLQASKPIRDIVVRARAAEAKKTASKYRERITSIRQTNAARDVRRKLKKLYNDLKKRALKPTENKYIPAPLMETMLSVLETIDFRGGNPDTKIHAQLTDMYMRYEALKNDPDFLTKDAYDEQLSSMLQQLVDTVGETYVRDMTPAQLEQTYTILRAIAYTLNQKVKQIGRDTAISNYELGTRAIEEIRTAKGPLSKITKIYNNGSLSPMRFFRMISGWAKNSVLQDLADQLNEGQRKQNDIMMRGYQLFDEFVGTRSARKEFDAFHGKGKNDRILLTNTDGSALLDTNGKEVYITHDMLVALYLHSMNEDNLRHVLGGKMRIPDIDAYVKGNHSSAYENGHRVQLSEEVLTKLFNENLTEYDKKYAQVVYDFFNTFSKQIINETSMALNGYKKAEVDNYFPIHVDSDFLGAQFDSLIKDGTLEGMGILKQRVNSSKPIYLEGASDAVIRNLNSVAKYGGLAIAVKNFQRVYNVTTIATDEFGEVTDTNNDSVQNALNDKWGKMSKNYIENMLSDLQFGSSGRVGWDSLVNKFFTRARGMFAQATLGMNLSVTLKQAASYPTAAAELGWSPLAKALLQSNKKVDLNKLAQYTPIMWVRSHGFVNTELGDAVNPQDWSAKVPLLMGWIQAMDIATVTKLALATEYYIRQTQPSLTVGSDEYWRAVADKFNRVVELTQPNYSVMQRPEVLRSQNAILRSLTMFMTQRLQNYNILFDAVGEYSAARNSDDVQWQKDASRNLRRAVTSQAVAAAVIAAMTLAVNMLMHRMKRYRDDDDEITVESFMGTFFGDMISTVAGSFLGGSEIYEIINNFTNGTTYDVLDAPNITMVNDLIGAFEKFGQITQKMSKMQQEAEENGETYDASKDTDKLLSQLGEIGTAIAKFFGIPVENGRKLVEGVYYYSLDAANGTLWESDIDKSKSDYYKDMAKALAEGDKDKYQKAHDKALEMIVSDSKYEGSNAKVDAENKIVKGIQSYLVDNDERIRQAAEAMIAANTKEVGRIRKEMIAEGYPESAVVGAINTMTDKLKKGDTDMTNGYVEEYAPDLYETSDIVSAYRAGSEEALEDIIDYFITEKGMSEAEARKKVDETARKEIRSGLYNAIDSNDIATAKEYISDLQNHGAENKDIASSLTSTYKDMYLDYYIHSEKSKMSDLEKKLSGLGLTKKNGSNYYGVDTFKSWISKYQEGTKATEQAKTTSPREYYETVKKSTSSRKGLITAMSKKYHPLWEDYYLHDDTENLKKLEDQLRSLNITDTYGRNHYDDSLFEYWREQVNK